MVPYDSQLLVKLPELSVQLPKPVLHLPWADWSGESGLLFGTNKTAKLAGYLKDIQAGATPHIIAFGGAYSHLLLAVAYVAKQNNWPCTAIVRGDELDGKANDTLHQLSEWGMNLVFADRAFYREVCLATLPPDHLLARLNAVLNLKVERPAVIIPEGAAGPKGFTGFEELFAEWSQAEWWHKATQQGTTWVVPMGTGATLAAFRKHLPATVHVLGVTPFAEDYSAKSVNDLLGSLLDSNQIIDRGLTVFRPSELGRYAKPSTKLRDELAKWEAADIPHLCPTYAGFALAGLAQWLETPDGFDTETCVLVDTGGGGLY